MSMAYTTNQSLLYAIKNGDGVSWQVFYETYRPLIVFCGTQHLHADEVDDLLQNVMIKIFNAQKNFTYDPAKGLFRDYLGKIIQHEIINILRARPAESLSAADGRELDDSFEKMWLAQWEAHLFHMAETELKNRVSEITFQAFDLYALQGMPPKSVAKFLGLTISQVYKAKTVCKAIMQEIVEELSRNE
jgi:RNA polymerase sigma-70 factor (ECF subfamily)